MLDICGVSGTVGDAHGGAVRSFPHTNAIRTAIAEKFGLESVMMRRTFARIVTVGIALFLYASPVVATLTLADGGVHNIDYAVNEEIVIDFELPGLQTTVNILDGGSVSQALHSYENSVTNILGGWTRWISGHDSSRIAVSGGSINNDFQAHDNSQITISDGSLRNVTGRDSSQIVISGGSIGGWLNTKDNGKIVVSGGVFGANMRASGNGVLTIHGSDFAVDGIYVGNIELTNILGLSCGDEPYRRLTGTLLNGDQLNNDFHICGSGKIVLVPEPATLLLLGVGGVMLRKRRQA